MLKEIRTLVSSSGSASAASAAVVAPTRRASALFSQVAENEYRRHSILPGDAVDTRWARTIGKGFGADVSETPTPQTSVCLITWWLILANNRISGIHVFATILETLLGSCNAARV